MEEIHRQALGLKEAVLGKEHSGALVSVANLATFYWNQKRWEEAENLERQVMETHSKLLGHRHPDTVNGYD